MKKVSVIIPCYNATKWLPQCFLTLVGQSIGVSDIELIFVDDASTDDGATWSMLSEFEKAYPENIMIIHLEHNMRQGGARNVALSYATGEYISFVDADDFVSKDFLEKVYARAKETDADIVQFEYDYYAENIGTLPSKRQGCDEIIEIYSEVQRKNFLVSEKITYGCWNKIYRRNLIESARARYAEHVIYEEPLFVYPLLFYGNKYVTMKDKFYFYRQNENGTMHSDMKHSDTLSMHMQVQLAVWRFMKQTQFFYVFYEEIKLYFLHTYFYETLYFAKRRGFVVTMDLYNEILGVIKREVPDYDLSAYEKMIPKQMELYRLARSGMTLDRLNEFMNKL